MILKHKQIHYKKNRLQQLRGFYCVVQTGNMSKAAEKMRLNQSTVTLQIQSLERDLKTKLFEKNSKPLKLTEDGKLFYEMSSHLLHSMDGLYEEFLNRKKEENISKITISPLRI